MLGRVLSCAVGRRACSLAAPRPTTPPRCSTPIRPTRCTPTPTRCSTGRYSDAARKFEDLDRDHPYSPEARRAIVMAAYAYYKAGKYPEAIASAERYTTLHPGTKDAALAHHIIASAQLRRDQAIPRATRRRPARRWPSSRRCVQRYPDSPYAQAGGQPHPPRRGHAGRVGDERRPLLPEAQQPGRPPSTASRWSSPSTRRRRTSRRRCTASSRPTWRSASTPEAQTAAAVLGHNFPNSQWYRTRLRPAASRAA